MKHILAPMLFVLNVVTSGVVCAAPPPVPQQQGDLNRHLIDALTHGDTATALALVNAGANPNTRYTPPPASVSALPRNQPLRVAPLPVNFYPTAWMIACGIQWFPTFRKSTPSTTGQENLPLLRAMLAHGANVNTRTPLNRTLLHVAAEVGRVHTAQLLLQRGVNINVKDTQGVTPLMLAASNQNGNVVHLLLSRGANPNAQDTFGQTALHFAGDARVANRIIPDLLAHGADPNLRNKWGRTPLYYAQQKKRLDLVRLLTRGAK